MNVAMVHMVKVSFTLPNRIVLPALRVSLGHSVSYPHISKVARKKESFTPSVLQVEVA